MAVRGQRRSQWDNREALRVWDGKTKWGRVGSASLVCRSAWRPFVQWGGSSSSELSTLFENSHSSCVLADEAQAGVSMWVTVNETFRAEFRTGFLLTHRPSLHKARALLVKLPILLSVVSQAVNSQGPRCWKLLHLPRCLCLPCEHLQRWPTVHGTSAAVFVSVDA